MRRRLLNLASTLSLLACAAVCVVWVRSFYVIENRTIMTARATYEIGSGGGAVAVQRIEPGDGEVRWMRPRARFSMLGVELIDGRLNRRKPWTLVLLPYWVPAGVFAILPMVWILARARREARVAQRRCPQCGHDRDPDAACDACGFITSPESAASRPSSGRPARSNAPRAPAVP